METDVFLFGGLMWIHKKTNFFRERSFLNKILKVRNYFLSIYSEVIPKPYKSASMERFRYKNDFVNKGNI